MACFMVAEIGVNHNGNIDIAKQLIGHAKWAGANACKFQMWAKGKFPAIEHLRLTAEQLLYLKQYTEKQGLVWFCTPFDETSIEFLAEIGMKIWKVPSGRVVDIPHLKAIAEKKPEWVIMSLGQGYNSEKPSHAEIKTAINCFDWKIPKTLLIANQNTRRYRKILTFLK